MPYLHNEKWSVAIFAHNEAHNIVRCLNSILSQSEAQPFPIHVLANGCRDNTAQVVEKMARQYPTIQLITIDAPDKANAWNQYTHHIAPESDCHFFVDGDVVIEDNAFTELYKTLMASSQAVAVGGFPASGRSCADWCRRMARLGRLAGALYALRGAFLERIREQRIYVPAGLVGEDFFVTCLAKGQLNLNGLNHPSPQVVFAGNARFSFDSLSTKRPKDWLAYLNRLIRYQVREQQLLMLFIFMQGRTQQEIPTDVQTLYKYVDYQPRYRWRGRITPIDMIAVWKIRHATGKGN